MKLKKAIFEYIAFPDITIIPTKVAEILLKETKAKLIEEREIPFAPAVIINKGNHFEIPKERKYRDSVIIRTFDAIPVYPEEIYNLSKKVVKEIQKEANTYFTIITRRLPGNGRSKYYLISNSDIKIDLPFASESVGAIEGMGALIFEGLQKTNVKAFIILIDVFDKDDVNLIIKEVIDAISKYFDLKIKIEEFKTYNVNEEKKYVG